MKNKENNQFIYSFIETQNKAVNDLFTRFELIPSEENVGRAHFLSGVYGVIQGLYQCYYAGINTEMDNKLYGYMHNLRVKVRELSMLSNQYLERRE